MAQAVRKTLATGTDSYDRVRRKLIPCFDDLYRTVLEPNQAAVTGALGRLLAVAEAYPDLKSNQNFLALQSQLEGTENRIAIARRDYDRRTFYQG